MFGGFGSFRSRDVFLISLLGVVGIFLVGVGWFGADRFQQEFIREQARSEAANWAALVRSRLSNADATFTYGKVSERDQELIALVAQAGSVFRYRFVNPEGVIVLASRLTDLGRREERPFFKEVVQHGQEYITIETAIHEELRDQVQGTPTVAQAFVPLVENRRFKGAIHLFVDTTRQSALIGNTLGHVKWLLVFVVAMLGIVVTLVIHRNVKERNQEIETISRAHESLAKAEEEVMQLNEDLERRVEERTRELARANEDIKRLNEDLEARVEERTQQLNKTNEQLFRAVETANKINESLEQRVAERTAELNKANEAMMRMNADLEQRVAERTSEVNKAYDDIRQLNADLERRVDERTAELAEANRSIQELNADLELRVEERTTELQEAQKGLLSAERLAALGQLTATVSHELRNPLGAIRTAVYLIATMTQGKNLGIDEALKRAERSITRCDSIINELLDFTRQTPLALEETDFDEWIGQVLDEQNVPDSILVKRDFQMPGTRFAFDRERLRRVIINLVGNAAEAMKEQAESGGGFGEEIITVGTHSVGDRIEVVVQDTGPGIPPEKLEKIFEPLFSTKSFGVGLGLPIVRQIIEQHGGTIEVSSQVGQGTTFKITLPDDLGKPGEALIPDASGTASAERAA